MDVITAYNAGVEQVLAAQGVDVVVQLAALAPQQDAGALPPDQAGAMGPEGQLPPAGSLG